MSPNPTTSSETKANSAHASDDRSPRRHRWGPWVATAIIVLIVIAAAVAYFRPELFTPDPEHKIFRAERGTACAPLRRMESALANGETAEAKEAIKEAEAKAIDALDDSRVRFGKPERFALRLATRDLRSLRPRQIEAIREQLNVVGETCEDLPST
jgi:hypothetical protein